LIDSVSLPYIVSGLLEIGVPIVLAYFVLRQLRTSWKIWFIGALMFLVSLIRIPLNNYLTQLVSVSGMDYLSYIYIYAIHGLTAGVFEETSRYIGFRYLIRDEHYETGITYGAGHGGIESIFIVGINILTIGVLLATNPEAIPQAQLQSIYMTPWYFPFIGLFERLMTMIIQVCLSVMVLETLRTKYIRYFVYAILIHAAIDYTAILAVSYSVWYSEVVILGFTVCLAHWAYTKVKNFLVV
jgi:uncharacterized membrane protein YhfC